MTSRLTILLLILILFIAIFVRIYRLAEFPYGFHVDEVKAGWNALSILATQRDDHGQFLPAYYDSFGDQRPAGIIYSLIPSLLIFGRTVFAVRFPSAIFGALTVLPLFFLVKQLFKTKNDFLPLIAALFLALNPWHISVSRATSEVVISLFFTTLALYFSVRQISKPNFYFLFLSIFSLFLSYSLYHSIRLIAPFFIFTIFFFHQNRYLFFTLVLTLLMSILFMLNPASRSRFSQVSILNDFKVTYETQKMPSEEGPGHVFLARFYHNKIAAYAKRFLEEYVTYFSPQFLVGTQARPVRYQTPYFGLITYLELFFLVISLSFVYRHRLSIMFWLLLIFAPLSAAITIEDSPNLHRSLLMVLPLVVLAAYGFFYFTQFFPKPVTFLLLFLYFLNLSYYFHLYYRHGNFGLSTYYRDGGVLELISAVKSLESNYDYIIFSNYTDNPYPWLAFLDNYSPSDFNAHYRPSPIFPNSHNYHQYVFSAENCPTSKFMAVKSNYKLLAVNGEGCEVDPKLHSTDISLLKIINRPDSSPAFQLWHNLK